ncbi:NB-ARC domain-containing protein [Gloeothece verrucosa]|uniref:AAA ATPase n=1 Tax=Gloeothece verrucosa (strain PCC 7822) TaxID=497965 RepID=E0U714_GLOV7|nr:ATP-binding protein [Gloeothece verrucosa]ADN17170.1 AAA ATPase [Gloeothece verrucosa PCC 7822]
MANSLRASTQGLEIVDRARQRRGWTKTSTARWWQDAHTSRATLRRFWQGERIQQDIFIAICQAVGISNWQAITAANEVPDSPTPRFHWDEAPDLENFYGRHEELDQLEQWIINDRCKLVVIVGLAGIGKTSLALALSDHIQQKFEKIIWKSLQTPRPLISLLDSLLNTLDNPTAAQIEQGIIQLLDYLQKHRCLLILDGWETTLEAEQKPTYHQFLQRLSHARHQSCLLITSREKPSVIEIETKARCLSLKGLQAADALMLLKAAGFNGQELGLSALIKIYRGNPLALKMVTPLIQSLFGGNVSAFLSQNTWVVGELLRNIFQQQFERLSCLERDLLYWLAIWQEPVSLCRLQSYLLPSTDPCEVLEAIVALERRSLLEKWWSDEQPSFTLQPLLMKIVKDKLVEQAAAEISQVLQTNDLRYFNVLRTHCLLRPGTDVFVGDYLLSRLREQLWRVYGPELQQILERLLGQLQGKKPLLIGYIACNLVFISKQF